MIRSIACYVAALCLTAGTVSAELYNSSTPGGSTGATYGPCNTAFPVSSPGACQSCPTGSCPTGLCQQCPIPGGISFGGTCPTCPTMNSGSFCPSCPMPCPQTGSCPSGSCLPGCCMSWCIKTNLCCLDNTCQMPPHYAYQPACHGHYYFAPYNYQTVLKQKHYAQCQNQDPRFPYSVPAFEHAYGEVIGEREAGDSGEDLIQPAAGLPDLEAILDKQS